MNYNIPEPRLDPPEYEVPKCPVCGEECETIYKDIRGDVVGCDCCVESIESWTWVEEEEFQRRHL